MKCRIQKINNTEMIERISTNAGIVVPKNFIYFSDGKAYCCDCSDEYLEIKAGETLSVIAETSDERIVKKDGLIGRYRG